LPQPVEGWPNVDPVNVEWLKVLLPRWELANAELFNPVWLKDEWPMLELPDM
jgi:hypothetical protein